MTPDDRLRKKKKEIDYSGVKRTTQHWPSLKDTTRRDCSTNVTIIRRSTLTWLRVGCEKSVSHVAGSRKRVPARATTRRIVNNIEREWIYQSSGDSYNAYVSMSTSIAHGTMGRARTHARRRPHMCVCVCTYTYVDTACSRGCTRVRGRLNRYRSDGTAAKVRETASRN